MSYYILNNPTHVIGFIMTLMGACFGSFATVIIYRIPKGQSIITPRSHCDTCKKQLRFFENIPIVSFLILRGRCSYCHSSIGIRSTIIEIIFSLCLLGLYMKFGISIALCERFFFVFFLVCLSYIDIDTFSLPLCLLFFLFVLGIASSIIYALYPALYISPHDMPSLLNLMVLDHAQNFSLKNRILGALLGASLLMVINLAMTFYLRKLGRLSSMQWAMGFGDPLLIMTIGLIVGLSHLIVVLFIASLIGSIIGIISRFLPNKELIPSDIAHGALPYGPFLAIAAIYVYLF